MMEALLARDAKGTFDVHLSGGSPWGFTLQGGSEFNSKLVVAKITPGGKADQTKVLSIGDEVVAINGQICTARAEAIEEIRCSRQNVRLTIKRGGSSPVRQNGMPHSVSTKQAYALPNLYQTALEVSSGPDDFFTTYSVDPAKYARVAGHSQGRKPINAASDYGSLSASNEDLLEQYWGGNKNSTGSNSNLTNATTTSHRVTNGRMSPEDEVPVVPAKHRQIINTLHARAQSWSERRGHSLPEGHSLHGRHYTSPSRIQRVKVTSANITSSTSSLGSDEESPVKRPSPTKTSPISRQQHVLERAATEEQRIPQTYAVERQARPDDAHKHEQDWFERWLRDDRSYSSEDPNVSVSATRSRFEETEEKDENPQQERTSNFSRSKSFSGRPSYGVVVAMKGEGKSAHPEVSAFQAPLPPNRYSSSDLLREKPSRKSLPSNEFWKSSTTSLPADVDSRLSRTVATIQEGDDRSIEVRIPISPKSSVSSSLTNLDSITDSNGSRRSGPAPPPRRSESKLLNSFRTRGKRGGPPQVVTSSTRDPTYNEPRHALQEPPRHVASRSWPSDHLGDNSRTSVGDSDRQSWHAQSRDPRERQSDPRERQPVPRDSYRYQRQPDSRHPDSRDRQTDPRDRQIDSRDMRQTDPRDKSTDPRDPRDRQPDSRDRQTDPRDRPADPRDRRSFPSPQQSQTSPPKSTSISVKSVKTPPTSVSYDGDPRPKYRVSSSSSSYDGSDSRPAYRVSSSNNSYDGGNSRSHRGSSSNNSYDGGSKLGGNRGSPSSSSYDDLRPVYRSASVEFQPSSRNSNHALRPQQSARSQTQASPRQTQPVQNSAPESGPGRIEDTEILQKLMRDSETANSHASVQSKIKSFERGSPRPPIEEGPDVEQLRPRTQHQATWDRQHTPPLQTTPDSEGLIRGARTPPPVMPKKPKEESVIISSQNENRTEKSPQERETPPVNVTSMVSEFSRTEPPWRAGSAGKEEDFSQQKVIVTTSPVSKQTLSVAPVEESVTRSESTSEQEREIVVEEMFKKMSEGTSDVGPKSEKPRVDHNLIHDKMPLPPPPSVGDDEVFADESLPPPPPPTFELETSHDDLPLPTPPREVFHETRTLREGREESPRPQIVHVIAVEPEVKSTQAPRRLDPFRDEEYKRTSLSKGEQFHKDENTPAVKTTAEYSTQERVHPVHKHEVPTQEENKRNAYKLSRSMEDLSVDRGFGKEEYLSRVISESRKRFGDEYKRHSYGPMLRNREDYVRPIPTNNARPISTGHVGPMLTEKELARREPFEKEVRVSARIEETEREPYPPSNRRSQGLRDSVDGKPASPYDNRPDSSLVEKRASYHEEKPALVRDEKEGSVFEDENRFQDRQIMLHEKRTSFHEERRASPNESRNSSRADRRSISPVEKRSSFHEERAIADESSTSLSLTENHREQVFAPISPDRSLPVSESSSSDRTPESYRHSRGEIPPPLVITSTPTGDDRLSTGDLSDNRGFSSPFSDGSNLSTPNSSRPNSMVSPKLEQLDKEKGELVDSMKRKIEDLKAQMNEITDEIDENERLGSKVTVLVEGKTTTSEFAKYQRFTGELNKIVLLLLSLTQRMHRYEKTLGELDMSEEADRQQGDILQDKIEYVKNQYEEACKIKEVNDKRGEVVSKFLESYLDEEEFADFQYYIDMKTQLALMHAEIRDKVKMGEERLNVLSSTAIDWSVTSFSSY